MSRRWQALGLGLGTLGCVALLPVGAALTILSPAAFDAPASRGDPAAWLAFVLAAGLWVVCVLGPYAAWIGFSRRQPLMPWAAIASPLIWSAAMVAAWRFVPG